MMIYLCMTLFATFFAYAYRPRQPAAPHQGGVRLSALWILLSFCIVLGVSVMRRGVGADYDSYVQYFEWNRTVGSEQEIGFIYFNKLIGLFTDNAVYMFAVAALITIGLFYWGIVRSSADVGMSVFLFITMGVFYQSLSAVRQMMAVALIFFAFTLYRDKRRIPALFLLVLAPFFHTSAVIMLVLIPLSVIKLKQSYYLMLFPVSAAAAVLLFRPVMRLVDTRYAGYYSSSEYFNFGLLAYHLLLSIGVLVLCMLFYKPLIRSEGRNTMLINLCAFSAVFMITISWLPTLSRFVQYFIPFYMLLIPEILQSIPSKFTKKWMNIFILAGYLAYSIYFIKTSSLNVLPYQIH